MPMGVRKPIGNIRIRPGSRGTTHSTSVPFSYLIFVGMMAGNTRGSTVADVRPAEQWGQETHDSNIA